MGKKVNKESSKQIKNMWGFYNPAMYYGSLAHVPQKVEASQLKETIKKFASLHDNGMIDDEVFIEAIKIVLTNFVEKQVEDKLENIFARKFDFLHFLKSFEINNGR